MGAETHKKPGSSRPYNKCIKLPKEMTAWGRGEVNRSRVLRQLWSEGQIGGGNTEEKALQEAGEGWHEGAMKTKSGKESKGPWGEGGRQGNAPGRVLPTPALSVEDDGGGGSTCSRERPGPQVPRRGPERRLEARGLPRPL